MRGVSSGCARWALHTHQTVARFITNNIKNKEILRSINNRKLIILSLVMKYCGSRPQAIVYYNAGLGGGGVGGCGWKWQGAQTKRWAARDILPANTFVETSLTEADFLYNNSIVVLSWYNLVVIFSPTVTQTVESRIAKELLGFLGYFICQNVFTLTLNTARLRPLFLKKFYCCNFQMVNSVIDVIETPLSSELYLDELKGVFGGNLKPELHKLVWIDKDK